jgi:hypothetical protein
LTKGDVQTGTVTGDITLSFSKWSPSGTRSTVEAILTVTPGRKITLPDTVSLGLDALVGFTSATKTITVPAGVTRLHYTFSTIDCGTTVEIASVDGSRIATQVQYRNFDVLNDPYSVVGKVGDVEGDVAYYSEALWVCKTAYNGTDSIWAPVSGGGGGGGSTNPGSINGTLQFNDGGYFNGSSNLAFNKTTSTLTVGGTITSQSLTTANITATGNVDLTAATVSVDSSTLSISGGTSGQVLSTDGSGVLSWITPTGSAGTGTVNNGTATQLAMYTATGTVVNSISNLTWASNTFTVTGNTVMPQATINSLTVSGTSNLGVVGQVKVFGGTAGQVLTSAGGGDLVWATPSSSGGSSSGVGTVNTGTATQLAIYNTDGRTVDSVANLKWASNTFTVTGNVTANATTLSSATITGNLSAGNITTTGSITANSFVTTGTGPVSITSATGGITLTPSTGSAVNVNGSFVVKTTTTAPTGTATVGQIIVDATNLKIWVYTNSGWKSATLS